MYKLVSIIIPVYNGEKTIQKTIQSVLSQSYSNIEIILVDDCSTDNTIKVITQLTQKDNRIHFFQNTQNRGVAHTRNFACSVATGDYLAFLDSDDLWHKEKLAKQLNYMQKTKADICYTAYNMIDKEDRLLSNRFVPSTLTYTDLLKENSILCSSVLLNRKILPREPFSTSFFHEDFILWLTLLKQNCKAVGLNENLVTYRTGGRSADKRNAMKYRWFIYRKQEHLSLFQSAYYFAWYALNGIKKYYLKK